MLALLFIIPIAAVIAITFCAAPARLTALGAAVANLVLALISAFTFDSENFVKYWHFESIVAVEEPFITPAFGYLNGGSLVMTLLATIVTVAAVLAGKCPEDKKQLWYNSILLISAGAVGAFISLDLFFFYAFHELALIPTFLMIGMLGRGDRKHIAWKTTIYLAFGSIVLLAGLVWLASLANTYYIPSLVANIQNQLEASQGAALANLKNQLIFIFGLLLVGFGTLVSLFPFHSWAAPAYASAPAPVAMLHSGVLKKFGLYGLIQIPLLAFPSVLADSWLLCALLIALLFNIIWIGLITIKQARLDLMIGNSSVMHMGYVFLAIAAFCYHPENKIAIPAATLLMFAHGISVAMSFNLIDVIERKTGTLEINQLGGLARTAPKIAFLFGLVGMASIGLPGLANFAGEVMVFIAGFEAGAGNNGGYVQAATMVAIWGVVISAVYMLRAFKNTFHGNLVATTEKANDISFLQKIPVVLLGFTLLAVGVYPNLILQFLN